MFRFGVRMLRRLDTGPLPPDHQPMNTHATAQSGALPGNARQTDSYVIAISNQKGGVGKTSTVLGLAAYTAKVHGRALVVDVDPQANAYDLTQAMADPGYDVIHEMDPRQLTRVSQLRDWDTVLVDTPGSLAGRDVLGEVISEVLARSTYVIIPYDHMPESLLPTVRTAAKVTEARVPYAVVVTKVDPRLIGTGFVEDAWRLLDHRGIRHFRTVIRWYRAWPNSLQAGVPITRWNERYAPKLREDIGSLHAELLLDLGRRDLNGGRA